MAVVSNIFYNLAPWASGTFVVGQRCSNAGNAYQCSTGGTSTAAPTGTSSIINNGGTAVFQFLSAVNFTSLQAWANALPTTLTSSVVAQVWNTGPITTTAGTPFLTLSGHTTTPTNSITILAPPGDSFAAPLFSNPAAPLNFNSAIGVTFILPATAGNTNYFQINDDNVTVGPYLQFQDPLATSNSAIIQFANLNAGAITGCLFSGFGQTNTAPVVTGGTQSTITNCLFIDNANVSTFGVTFYAYATNTTFANCTFVAPNSPSNTCAGFLNQTASGFAMTATNCVFIGYSASFVFTPPSGSATATSNYCLYSAGVNGGFNITLGPGNIFSQTAAATFVAASSNFRVPSSSAAVNAGTTDTTDIPQSNDIANQMRPSGQWTIGAYQFTNSAEVGSAAGKASIAGVSSGNLQPTVGSAAGHATVAAVANLSYISVGTANGQASALGKPASVSVGKAAGVASVVAYDVIGAISAVVKLNNPGTQVVNTPFTVTGTYTLTPDLVFANDASATFTPIPASGVSSLGTANFAFNHPGVPTAGSKNLLVEDTVTDASSAVNYNVSTTAPPPIVANVSPQITNPPTSLQNTIPAYLYQQYYDDDNVQAFVGAYNAIAQGYLNWFNNINLPVYTGLSGPLLDWVANGLYGIPRPTLAITQTGPDVGPFNTYTLNSIPINSTGGVVTSQLFTVTDDIFKRIITWSLYKNDGFQFNVMWLKRRVMRFLAGVNGTDYTGPTDQVSVKFSGLSAVNITVSTGAVQLTAAPLLQAAVLSGNLTLPFQYTFNVLIN
jgi:hypothetical protein